MLKLTKVRVTLRLEEGDRVLEGHIAWVHGDIVRVNLSRWGCFTYKTTEIEVL